MTIGQFRRRVRFQKKTTVRDEDTGYSSTEWADQHAGTIPARIEPLSTREFIASGATQARVSTRIVVRFRGDIDPDWRVIDDRDKVYSIEGPPLPDQKSGLEYQTLVCNEGEDET